ncbi:pyridoxamine 5'-phosphate oxidase family protein [Paraglaciecola sp. 20A4]|uniref:pyridoxamine 5'-phosphate oxidase family protein n=1 Tax=Paraglaciecola sp. 20A4 TaxID=2687288 RepID=UPI00140E4036|nr:pyridoxamine 5'-phosphate oxidase family protein [Paraglaciecola sp. 20A4]
MQQHPSWQSTIERALEVHLSSVTSRYLQLATVDRHGYPHCRTIVFRGFNEGKNQIYLHTDNRSEKMSHLTQKSQVEACWYFAQTREQFRFSGYMDCIAHQPGIENQHIDNMNEHSNFDAQKLRHAHWRNLSDALRESYADDYDAANPSEHFVLLRLHITQVDYLRLMATPHLRVLYRQDAQSHWHAESIRP